MPRKRTPEEFIKKVKETRPDYEVLSEYVNNSTKVKVRHECGYEYEVTPGHLLDGRGCPKCARESKRKKLSAEPATRFYSALNNMGFELVDPNFVYTNCFEKVALRCKKCGRVCYKTPANLVRGHGCKHCSQAKAMSREKFVKLLEEKAPDWELAGDYSGMKQKTLFVHKVCGAKYEKRPENLFANPEACKFCNAKRLSASHEDFLERVKSKTDYEILSRYVNSNTKIHVRHKKCGHDFWTLPLTFARREEGCPFCKNNIISKKATTPPDVFAKQIEAIDGFKLLTSYINARMPIKLLHEKCGKTFETTPANFLRCHTCPYCKNSQGENEMYEFVKGLVDEEVVHGDRTHLENRRELDIWLPSRNLAIEYDGLFIHSDYGLSLAHKGWTEKQVAGYALWKTNECHKQGIRLIHFFEDEWIKQREIVEDKIRAILKIPAQKIFARKLTLQPVSPEEASAFYNKNHIQGGSKYSLTIGLFDGDELVAAQSFRRGSRRKDQARGSWELVRYATKLGTVVVGGFSRCLKWFEREYSPREIVSFADLRVCDKDNNVYIRNGFVADETQTPQYWYVKGLNRWHKSAFRKQGFKSKYPKIYSPSKTEAEMAKEAGLLVIHDCGKIRYVKTF